MKAFGLKCLRAVLAVCLLMAPGVSGAAVADAQSASPASLSLFNREVIIFRASLLGVSPQERAHRAAVRIHELMDAGGRLQLSLQNIAQGTLVQLDGKVIFMVTPEDADVLRQESSLDAAQGALSSLQRVIAENRESRDLRAMLRAAGLAALVSVLFGAALWLLARGRRSLQAWLLRVTHRQAERLPLGEASRLLRPRLASALPRVLGAAQAAIALLLCYEWLSIVLAGFPYTRAWGEQLNTYLVEVLLRLLAGIASAVPGLFFALLIFLLTRFAARLLNSFFTRVQHGDIKLSWLDADLALTTRRLCNVGLWLFALAIAYPYLPGAQTEAFKGVSVLLGLMISIGASSLVGQGASGLILTYARVFRRGEYVRVAEHEGTVMELGMFTTRIRTGLGEELTLPNSLVLSNVSKNYSRTVNPPGFVLDTTVTIGYDTPWRQVEAMLVAAACRTPGVLQTPAPRVFQTSLSDFYPEYRVVCQALPSEPRPRAEVLSALHANIQDVFNEYGVQIMSPHYLGDPACAKLVPREGWSPAPAKQPEA